MTRKRGAPPGSSPANSCSSGSREAAQLHRQTILSDYKCRATSLAPAQTGRRCHSLCLSPQASRASSFDFARTAAAGRSAAQSFDASDGIPSVQIDTFRNSHCELSRPPSNARVGNSRPGLRRFHHRSPASAGNWFHRFNLVARPKKCTCGIPLAPRRRRRHHIELWSALSATKQCRGTYPTVSSACPGAL